VKTAFFGSGAFALASLQALLEAGIRPVLVVTQPPRRRRRRGEPEPTLVHATAEQAGLPVAAPPKVNTPESLERLRAAEADLFLVAEYGQILSRALLAIPARGTLNVHGSILPRWRGATPVTAAILAGDAETGVTIQRTVFELDAGPMLATRRVAIGARETKGQLFHRLAALGGEMLVEVVSRIAASDPPDEVEQDAAQATYCRRLKSDDTWIDWTRTAVELERMVRALQPRPGARAVIERQPSLAIEVRSAAVAQGEAEPGEIAAVAPDGIDVGTGGGLLRITELKPAGRKFMDARSFLNGYRVEKGERFR